MSGNTFKTFVIVTSSLNIEINTTLVKSNDIRIQKISIEYLWIISVKIHEYIKNNIRFVFASFISLSTANMIIALRYSHTQKVLMDPNGPLLGLMSIIQHFTL